MYMENRRNSQISLKKATLGLCLCGLLVLTGCPPEIVRFTPERGIVGSKVTIIGKHFGNTAADNEVELAGLAVPDITVPQKNRIVAEVPPGARTGVFSLTTDGGSDDSDNNFVVIGHAIWTFMVYLDADNNLEPDGITDFLEMASVGTSDEVNIVVQMDRRPGYSSLYDDWTDTRRFLIQNGDDPSSAPVQNLGEENMGDPNVLQDFVEWAVTNYPAEHYALVIWNHGDGWRNMIREMSEAVRSARAPAGDWAVVKAVATDDTDNDKLYMKEVQTALQNAKFRSQGRTGTSVKLDLVGFDACLMGMVEVAYALRDVANYVVGSEETEPLGGWPYDAILGALDATPSFSPEDLAGTIVTEYVDSYPTTDTHLTQSAVDVTKLSNLVSKINAFTNEANSEWANLETARTNSFRYHHWCPSNVCWGVDLWDFANEVYSEVTSSAIQDAALDVKNAIDDFVINERHSSDMGESHGIAIYFPSTQTTFNNDPDHTGYEQDNTDMPVDFVKYQNWDNWLKDYYSNIP